MKKILYIIPILLLIVVLYNPTSTTIVESNKYLTPANPAFDDDNFYKCVTNTLGLSEDTNVTDEQLASITYLSCSPSNYNDDSTKISSTKGLEKLTGLTSLILSDHNLTSIDLSQNTALTTLYLQNNQLTNIDLSHNTALTYLSIYNNQLTSIDLSGNTALTTLYLYNNQLTNIDVSHNTALTYLSLYDNKLTNIDVSHNTALTSLYLENNQLTSLDVSHNTALTNLVLSNNQLTSLDVSHNTNLKYLEIDENVEVIGANENTNIIYYPQYLFKNKILKFNESNFKKGIYEYTVNVSNSIDELALGLDYHSGAYYNCQNNQLCGGRNFYYLMMKSATYTLNNNNLQGYEKGERIYNLQEEQCRNALPCNIYNGEKLVGKIDENGNMYYYNDNNEIFYQRNNNGTSIYLILSNLDVGANVLKFIIDEDHMYTINIIRSEKELNNDPSKELEDIAKDIVDSNSIDVVPDTGLLFNVIVTILGISMIGTLYYIYYKGKVKS